MSPFSLTSLPDDICTALLRSSEGRDHLLAVGQRLVTHAAENPDLLALAQDVFMAAFEADPFTPATVDTLLSLDAMHPVLGSRQRTALQLYHDAFRLPEDVRYMQRLLGQGQVEKLRTYIARQQEREPGNPFWVGQAYTLAMLTGDPAEAVAIAARPAVAVFPALVQRLVGDALLVAGDWSKAAKRFKAAQQEFPFVHCMARYAASLVAGGDMEAAREAYGAVLTRHPWQTSTLLCAHDALTGVRGGRTALDGVTTILLYTWNKAEHLEQALQSLLEADLTGARIVALDNGSTDNTQDVLHRYSQRFAADDFRHFQLPLNVGAPAARNWLLSEEDVRASDHILFLDDDAVVPADFLSNLGHAVALYPQAGVWGCKVVDAGWPQRMQSVGLHMQPYASDSENSYQQFSLSGFHLQAPDMAQFDYMRPCASVTGCCHLFRAATILESGGFDIRFTPSQHDDVDHDLRLCIAGTFPVYQGHLKVEHIKATGMKAQTEPDSRAPGFANHYKLHTKYTSEQVHDIMRTEAQLLLEDVERKRAVLSSL